MKYNIKVTSFARHCTELLWFHYSLGGQIMTFGGVVWVSSLGSAVNCGGVGRRVAPFTVVSFTPSHSPGWMANESTEQV